ncbi:hypothetical protein BD779DRAFT_1671453 [Infundibulicybe gibba]|nr:hypothetical protein BD779DRAFT_1671453 [Infundibulicybe gibba]
MTHPRNSRFPSLLSTFPTELLDEIAQLSEPPELLALCQTSRQFNFIATRLLYRTLNLDSPVKAVQCCRTISRRPLAAKAVRHLGLDFPEDRLCHSFFKLVAAAIARSEHLFRLDISTALPLVDCLLTLPDSLPNLQECCLPFCSNLIPFLRRHRTLKILVIQPPGIGDMAQALHPVYLPNLCSFIGPSILARYLIPQSNTQMLTIFWKPNTCSIEETMMALAESNKKVVVLDNLVRGWDEDVLNAVAAHLPDLQTLRIRNISLAFRRDGFHFLTVVGMVLKSFTSLVSISISSMFISYNCTHSDLDQEFDIVNGWGQQLSTLSTCTLPSGTKWLRVHKNAWFPKCEGDNLKVKSDWLVRALLSLRFPLELYMTGACDATARELMEKLRDMKASGVRSPLRLFYEQDEGDESLGETDSEDSDDYSSEISNNGDEE